MSTEPKTIDITPSWEGILPLLVHVAEHGTTAEGRNAAMDELMRLARTVDQMNAEIRAQGETK